MFENLVFSGGGTKCISYIGVLKYLEEKDLIKNIKRIVSTSGGALFSLVVVLGYCFKDIKDIVLGISLNTIKDINTENILDFFNNYGLDTGRRLEHLLKLLLKKKHFKEDITFSELYQKTNIEYTVTGTCLNTRKTCYFNHINNPNMPVFLAVRISCSIPIIFNYVSFNDSIFVDGGVLDNYPIEFLQNSENTIGFYVDNKEKDYNEITSIYQFMLNILLSMSKKIQSKILSKYKNNTIVIRCDFEGTNFQISNDIKTKAIENGYQALKTYIEDIEIKNEIKNIINDILNKVLTITLENE